MTKKEEALVVLIVIIGITLMTLFIKLQLALIHILRALFWVDLGLIVLTPFLIIIFIFIGFKDDFDGWIFFIIAGACFVLFLTGLFTISGAYNGGYSDEALQKEADLRNQLKQYQEIMDLVTGKKMVDIEIQVLDETINSLCETTPDYPCKEMKQNLKMYKDIIGLKSDADKIANIMGLANKK